MLKRLGIIACAGLLCMGSTAAAEPIDNVIQDSKVGKLTITGTLPAWGEFTVQVLKKEKVSDDLNDISNNNVKEIIQAIDMFETETEDYTVDIVLGKNADSGSYLIRINGAGLAEPYEFTYEKYYNVAQIQELFEKIKNGDKNGILNILEIDENREILGLTPDEVYGGMSDTAKEIVAEKIYTDKAGIETVETLREYFKESSIIVGITHAEKGEISAKILKQYGEVAGFSEYAKYEVFMNMTETGQNLTGERLIGKDFSVVQNRESLFNEAVILAELENASGAADFKEILRDNKGYFESGVLDKYLNMSDSSSVDAKIMDEISKIDSLKELAEKIKELTSKTTSKPSGNSGGGGSGGGMSVTAPANVVSTANNMIFNDISEVSWAETAINYLYSKGIVNGKAEGLFYPNDPVKREEFVKMLVLAFGLTGEGNNPNFYDVNESDWYHFYVTEAYKSGIVKGVSNERFGVGEYITRQDMAVMVYRIIKDVTSDFENAGVLGFTDKTDISEYAREAVAGLRAAGVVSGMADGSFKPMSGSTRAQAACIIFKAIEFAEGGV